MFKKTAQLVRDGFPNWPPLYWARAEIDEMESKLLAFDQYLTWPVGQTDGSALYLVLVLQMYTCL